VAVQRVSFACNQESTKASSQRMSAGRMRLVLLRALCSRELPAPSEYVAVRPASICERKQKVRSWRKAPDEAHLCQQELAQLLVALLNRTSQRQVGGGASKRRRCSRFQQTSRSEQFPATGRLV
jgi:hypothetical protein